MLYKRDCLEKEHCTVSLNYNSVNLGHTPRSSDSQKEIKKYFSTAKWSNNMSDAICLIWGWTQVTKFAASRSLQLGPVIYVCANRPDMYVYKEKCRVNPHSTLNQAHIHTHICLECMTHHSGLPFTTIRLFHLPSPLIQTAPRATPAHTSSCRSTIKHYGLPYHVFTWLIPEYMGGM